MNGTLDHNEQFRHLRSALDVYLTAPSEGVLETIERAFAQHLAANKAPVAVWVWAVVSGDPGTFGLTPRMLGGAVGHRQQIAQAALQAQTQASKEPTETDEFLAW